MLLSTIAPPDLSPDVVCNDGAMAATMSNKRKQYNRVHYLKKSSQHINHDGYNSNDSAQCHDNDYNDHNNNST
jgi:hypothetical protein